MNYYNGWKRMTLINSAFPRWQIVLSWMDGSLKFSEQPFMSIAKDLERKFNVRIRVESDLLRKEIFSGSFTKDYSLDKILREVDVDHKYVWTRSGDEIIIKDK